MACTPVSLTIDSPDLMLDSDDNTDCLNKSICCLKDEEKIKEAVKVLPSKQTNIGIV